MNRFKRDASKEERTGYIIMFVENGTTLHITSIFNAMHITQIFRGTVAKLTKIFKRAGSLADARRCGRPKILQITVAYLQIAGETLNYVFSKAGYSVCHCVSTWKGNMWKISRNFSIM